MIAKEKEVQKRGGEYLLIHSTIHPFIQQKIILNFFLIHFISDFFHSSLLKRAKDLLNNSFILQARIGEIKFVMQPKSNK